jgi:hypothetical protein
VREGATNDRILMSKEGNNLPPRDNVVHAQRTFLVGAGYVVLLITGERNALHTRGVAQEIVLHEAVNGTLDSTRDVGGDSFLNSVWGKFKVPKGVLRAGNCGSRLDGILQVSLDNLLLQLRLHGDAKSPKTNLSPPFAESLREFRLKAPLVRRLDPATEVAPVDTAKSENIKNSAACTSSSFCSNSLALLSSSRRATDTEGLRLFSWKSGATPQKPAERNVGSSFEGDFGPDLVDRSFRGDELRVEVLTAHPISCASPVGSRGPYGHTTRPPGHNEEEGAKKGHTRKTRLTPRHSK